MNHWLPQRKRWPQAMWAFCLIALAVLAWALPAQAHKPSDAYVQLTVRGAIVDQRFDIALRDLERDLALDADENGALDWREVRTRWADIEALAAQGLAVSADGQPCRATAVGPPQLDDHSDGRYAVLQRQWTCPQPVRQLQLTYRLFASTDPAHRGIVRVQWGNGGGNNSTDTAVLTPGAPTQAFAGRGAAVAALAAGVGDGTTAATPRAAVRSFLGFVPEGVHHILIGSDHILFLLALLLPALLQRCPRSAKGRGGWQPAPRLRPVLGDVLRVVTAFTVAHSVTLALAAFDIVNPPPRWVESTIAASVVLAALNNLFPVFREGRWKLTFVFGLVHGFGFASALKDLGLARGTLVAPLLGFNVGVELGQLAIVAIFMGLAWRLRATRFYIRGLLGAGSVLIALLALGWLIERAFDVKLPLPL